MLRQQKPVAIAQIKQCRLCKQLLHGQAVLEVSLGNVQIYFFPQPANV